MSPVPVVVVAVAAGLVAEAVAAAVAAYAGAVAGVAMVALPQRHRRCRRRPHNVRSAHITAAAAAAGVEAAARSPVTAVGVAAAVLIAAAAIHRTHCLLLSREFRLLQVLEMGSALISGITLGLVGLGHCVKCMPPRVPPVRRVLCEASIGCELACVCL